jgi:hypothetical protein
MVVLEHTRHIPAALEDQIYSMLCSWQLLETMMFDRMENHRSLLMLLPALPLVPLMVGQQQQQEEEVLVVGNREVLALVVVFHEAFGAMDHKLTYKILYITQ